MWRPDLRLAERARHAQQRSGDHARLKRAAGCGSCSTGVGTIAKWAGANGNKDFPSNWPGMINP